MGRTSHMDESKVVIQMKDIVKKFGDFTANDHINLTVHKGEVHAILGENGAGKSTMMNVLCGLYKPTSGQIFINEKEVHFNSPKDAIDIGIGMVHQHFMLIQPFTVTENIILGMEPTKGLSVDKATARKKVLELSERYGMKVDPDAKIEDISVGMQQRVEILKVLYRGAETLILDEPTASLTPQEIEGLMEIIDNLTADGKSIILITHKLKEITASSDNCTIIRQGKYIRTVKVSDVNENDLAAMMVGRDVNFKVDKKDMEPGEVVLEVDDLHAKDYRGVEILKGFHLNVRRGEIVGLAGVDGNGQTELVEVLTGLRKAESGKVTVLGELNPISNGIDDFATSPSGGTPIVGVLSKIMEDMESGTLPYDEGCQVILLTDGYATDTSFLNFELNKTLKKFNKKKISISTVGLGYVDEKLLNNISGKTGGISVTTDNVDELEKAMASAVRVTDSSRNLLSSRARTDHNWLYALMRIIFLIILGAGFLGIKLAATDDTTNVKMICISSMIGIVAGALVMEIGLNLILSEFFARLLMSVLFGLMITTIEKTVMTMSQGGLGDIGIRHF